MGRREGAGVAGMGMSLLVRVPRGAGRRAPHTCSAWLAARAFPEASVALSQAKAGPRDGRWGRGGGSSGRSL